MSIISIKNLTYSYPGSLEPILNNVNLEIEQGDFLAIIGSNGCGKSTLCKTLNGLIPHFISGNFNGEVLISGLDTTKVDIGTLALKVGYVYQDFENQIVRPTVLDDASYACLNYAIPDYKQKGLDALSSCGLVGKENDYIWQLSGGQTHLLALAGVVSLQPDILILDEPIAQLDPKHADQIYEVLKDLNENYGKTIIVIEHHTEYIADYCKNVVLMKDGKIEWKLPSNEALTRVDEITKCNIYPPQVTMAAHQLKQYKVLDDYIYLPTTINQGLNIFKDLSFNRVLPFVNDSTYSPSERNSAAYFKDVSVSYLSVKGSPQKIFNKLTLDIREGEKIAVIGSNGAGKSTLMKLMTGLLKPKSGEVFINGESIRNMKIETLSLQISLVYQNSEAMFIKDSIYGDISYAMQVRNVDNWEEKTSDLLKRFRLEGLKERDGRLLSGGQMRRASLAIGVALNPKILLLDEPTANLDIATRKELMHTLNDIKHITETVIIATHDMQLVSEWAERIIVLCDGRVVADGNRNEIFGNHDIVNQVGIRPPEIFSMGQNLNENAHCYTVDEFINCFGVI